MSQPHISLCMIVRDSARTLPACLASIAPWVDEMIVVDTGSVDETREIARQFGARVFEFPWIDDFAAARNDSVRHATGEWLFWMDSDDTIDEGNGKQLRALAASTHDSATLGYVIQVHCPTKTDSGQVEVTVVDHVKLFRNDPRLQFEGRIHEQILPSIRALGGEVGWTDLFVEHSGSDQSPEGKQRKVERDLRILKHDLADRPDHPFVLFNLGMTYEDIGDYSQAETWLRRCLEHSRPGESHIRKAYALLASSLQQQGRIADAAECCRAGLSLFPHDIELLFRVGALAQEQGRVDDAVAAYRRVIANEDVRHFTSMDRGITGHKARHNLALAYAEQGDPGQAELQFRLALGQQPHFQSARRGLGQLLLAQGKLAALDLLIGELRESPEAEADSYWLAALLAEKRGQSHAVEASLEQALKLSPDHLPAHQDYCRWLFHHGTLQQAEESLRELLARWPDHAASFHNLGLVLARQGRLFDARAALEQSLRLRPGSESTQVELERLMSCLDAASAPAIPTDPDRVSDLPVQSDFSNLPACHSRRHFVPARGKFFCAHPGVGAVEGLVSPAFCRLCPLWQRAAPDRFRTPADVPALRRFGSCRFLGSFVGFKECDTCRGRTKLKLFNCHHERHDSTTSYECLKCKDYVMAATEDSDTFTRNVDHVSVSGTVRLTD
jgi:Tfp pilus assembly protein PilF